MVASNAPALVAFHHAFPRICRYQVFLRMRQTPPRESFIRAGPVWASSSLQPVHRGIPGRETNPCFHGGGHRAQLLFRSRLQGGGELNEITLRNLFMMSRRLRSVFVGAVRGPWDGGAGTRMERGMTGGIRTPEPGGTEESAPDFEFPKNSINMDKFLKRFMGRTNVISIYSAAGYQGILK